MNNLPMGEESIIVFTHKSTEFLLSINGSTSWKLDPARARRCKYIICVKNANHPHANLSSNEPPHRAAFLIGRVSDIVKSSTNEVRNENRYTVKFDKYAEIESQNNTWNNVWGSICKNQRWPVKYRFTHDLKSQLLEDPNNIDFDSLDFKNAPGEDWNFAEKYLEEENMFLGVSSLTNQRNKSAVVENSTLDISLDHTKSPLNPLENRGDGITIKEAKRRLSIGYDLPEESIEIILKG